MGGDYRSLPPDLPAPVDDGAADHLEGLAFPSVRLDRAGGGDVCLPEAMGGRGVLFVYPRTGTPGEPLPPGWDDIPGARGCTPQSCAYREEFDRFAGLGVNLFGLSAQDPAEQAAFHAREALPYELLNDRGLALADSLGLPTFEVAGMTLYRRITLVIEQGLIARAFYPVFPPDEDASRVLDWLGG